LKDDRLRIPVGTDYLQELGRAAYTFAYCEWQVAWSCERLRPGALRKIREDELTAGKIATMFKELCRNMPKLNERTELIELSTRFQKLVVVRNAILHGKPCTSASDQQRLSADKVIEINDLEAAADDFVDCATKLNDVYHRFLLGYVAAKA
jgi:hypothetical protein